MKLPHGMIVITGLTGSGKATTLATGHSTKAGFVTIIASCDIDQPGLQQLLFDLEARMPFLFVDQLAAQTPASFAASGDGKLRILLAASGQWQGTK